MDLVDFCICLVAPIVFKTEQKIYTDKNSRVTCLSALMTTFSARLVHGITYYSVAINSCNIKQQEAEVTCVHKTKFD